MKRDLSTVAQKFFAQFINNYRVVLDLKEEVKKSPPINDGLYQELQKLRAPYTVNLCETEYPFPTAGTVTETMVTLNTAILPTLADAFAIVAVLQMWIIVNLGFNSGVGVFVQGAEKSVVVYAQGPGMDDFAFQRKEIKAAA